jgi:alkanesulfonate monooxygenase SsuD/methylene tetrahydromethanopterin reductase-like flavin-dependent oxidoreductase (luciferase family)
MRIGMALPHYTFSIPSKRNLSWRTLLEVARWAEEMKFSSLWMSDHVYLDLSKYGGNNRPHSTFEYATTLGALASCTTGAELGVLVACAALRPPAVLAASAETIASVSERRFWLGLGAGWYPPDFEAAGVEFGSVAERMARLRDSANLVRSFLKPTSSVKTIIGGKGGPVLLKTVASSADGWNISWAIDPKTLELRIARLKELWNEHGRDGGGPHVSVGLTCLVASSEDELRTRFFAMFEDFGLRIDGHPDRVFETARSERLVCTTAELAEKIEAYRAAGVAELICGFGPVPFSFWKKGIAEEFVSAVDDIGLVNG